MVAEQGLREVWMALSAVSNGCPLLSEVSTASPFTVAWQDSPPDRLPLQTLYYSTCMTHFVTQSSLQSSGQTTPLNVVHAETIIITPIVMLSTSLPKCHFISMCAELRIRVYRYLFEDATALVRNVHDFKTCDLVGIRLWSTDCHKSILSTCRTIHVESKPILAGSMLLIICSSWWKTQDSFKVYYPDLLSSYLPNIHELRLEDNYRSHHWLFDTTRLPNLESLTLVGAGVLLTSRFQVLHDTAAAQLIKGNEDQHVVEFHLGLEDGTGPLVSPGNSPYLPWLVELLKRPGRTFRVFREHEYEFRITKFEADAVSGRLQRWMRLKFHADTGRLVRTVSAMCTMSGQWDARTVDLCASSNRQAGITVSQKREHAGIEAIYPI